MLVATLVALLLLLISWAWETVELRQDLFIDRVKKDLDLGIAQYESSYYCFEFEANSYFSQADRFGLFNPYRVHKDSVSQDTIKIIHESEGEKRPYDKIPIYSAGRVNLKILIEFDVIPKVKHDSELTGAEKFIRSYYKNCLVDSEGNRLADPVRLDSIIEKVVYNINPDAQVAYTIGKPGNQELIYSNELATMLPFDEPDLSFTLYEEDDKVPDLLISVAIPNRSTLFSDSIKSLYLNSGILVSIALILIIYMGWMHLYQKRLMSTQEDFVHSMTHEFNTPLSSIKLVAQKLLSSTDQSLHNSGRILHEEGKKLQTGINLVLTTTLIEKKEILLQKEDVDLNALLAKMVNKQQGLFEQEGIDVDLKLSEKLPICQGDIFHMENVFQNLFNNVLKHSGASNLQIDTHYSDGKIIVQFKDDGKGIEPAQAKSVFEKFGGRTNRGSRKGFGLGLYYSKTIIEMHHGTMQLIASGSRGAHFEIRLPHG